MKLAILGNMTCILLINQLQRLFCSTSLHLCSLPFSPPFSSRPSLFPVKGNKLLPLGCPSSSSACPVCEAAAAHCLAAFPHVASLTPPHLRRSIYAEHGNKTICMKVIFMERKAQTTGRLNACILVFLH